MPHLPSLQDLTPAATPLLLAAVYFGAVAGGFVTVLQHRLRRQGPRSFKAALGAVSRPGSACPACGRPLTWLEKLPLLGYVFCRGRCRGCKVSIPVRYPLLEAATIGGIVLTALEGAGSGAGWTRLAFGCLAAVLVALSGPTPRAAAILAALLAGAGFAATATFGADPGVAGPLWAVLAAAGLLPALLAAMPRLRLQIPASNSGLLALAAAALPWYGPIAAGFGLFVGFAALSAARLGLRKLGPEASVAAFAAALLLARLFIDLG